MKKAVIIRINNREHAVELNGNDVRVNGRDVPLNDVRASEAGGLSFESQGRRFHAMLDFHGEEKRITFNGRELTVDYETERHRLLRKVAGLGISAHVHADIKASMPGLVVRVNCQAGMDVKKGQPILILEAMKMENEVRSPLDGTIKEIRVKTGQPVEKGDLLVVLDK